MMFPAEEARGRRPTKEAIERVDAASAQGWFDAMLGGGASVAPEPIEAAIVGDISLDDALKLAATYLGSLPPRARIDGQTHAAQRRVKPSGISMTGEREVPGWQGKSYVVAGFFGADIKDLNDHRALAAGAKVLAARLAAALPEAENVGGDASASSVPSSVFPGFGLVLAVTEVEPERAPDALTRVNHAIESLCTTGPTPEELATAAGSLAQGATRMLEDSRYWSTMLAASAYRGYTPGEMAGASAAYRSMTPDAVLAALKKYNQPQRRISVIVKGSSRDGAAER
jgi:predicted Zn-dependent peptidase